MACSVETPGKVRPKTHIKMMITVIAPAALVTCRIVVVESDDVIPRPAGFSSEEVVARAELAADLGFGSGSIARTRELCLSFFFSSIFSSI